MVPDDQSLSLLIVGAEGREEDPWHGPDPPGTRHDFAEPCRQLGHAIAARSWTLVVGSGDFGTADRHVVEGARLWGRAHNGRTRVRLIRPGKVGWEAPAWGYRAPGDDENLDIHREDVVVPGDTSRGRWNLSLLRSVIASDVVLAIAGGELTSDTIFVAWTLRRPVVPLAAFGGAGRRWANVILPQLEHQDADKAGIAAAGRSEWEPSSITPLLDLVWALHMRSRPEARAPAVFVSHSSEDGGLPGSAYELLQAAGIPAQRITCTTQTEAGAAFGTSVADYLLEKAREPGVHLVLATPCAMRSTWVWAEYGIAWSSGKAILPVLARGMTNADAHPLVGRLVTVDGRSRDLVHQMVRQICMLLNLPVPAAGDYRDELERFIAECSAEIRR